MRRALPQGHAAGGLTAGHGGGLAGLHGRIEFKGVPGIGGSYAGTVHVDPR